MLTIIWTLFDTQGLPYVVVIDNATNSHTNNPKIIKIQPKNKFRKKQSSFDIEDLLESKLLSEAFVQIYNNFDADKVADKLDNSDKTAVNILVGFLETVGKKKKDLNKMETILQNYKTGSSQSYQIPTNYRKFRRIVK